MFSALSRPKLPTHFQFVVEPPDQDGDDIVIVRSERRRLKLKGRSLSEFVRIIVPLLDGCNDLAEIHRKTVGVFPPDEIDRCLDLLRQHGLIDEGDATAGSIPDGLNPQRNFLREASRFPKAAMDRLASSVVSVVGASGTGAFAVLALAAANVGEIRCIDSLPVSETDIHLSPVFDAGDMACRRTEALANKVRLVAPRTRFQGTAMDRDWSDRIDRSDFVLCCLDRGLSSTIYALNRLCFARSIPWTSASGSGFEGVLGPTVIPGETACFLCYKMRAVACTSSPEEEFAFERYLDARKRDDSGCGENLVFHSGILGHLAALEAFKFLTGIAPLSARGSIAVVDYLTLGMTRHVIMRRPGCPVCFPSQAHGPGA